MTKEEINNARIVPVDCMYYRARGTLLYAFGAYMFFNNVAGRIGQGNLKDYTSYKYYEVMGYSELKNDITIIEENEN